MGRRIAVVGSRKYPNPQAVRDFIRELPSSTIVISGGASGVDAIAASEARKCRLKVLEYFPNPLIQADIGFAAAAFARNERIVNQADEIVAFWDGSSNGTAHVIGLAERSKMPLRVMLPETN